MYLWDVCCDRKETDVGRSGAVAPPQLGGGPQAPRGETLVAGRLGGRPPARRCAGNLKLLHSLNPIPFDGGYFRAPIITLVRSCNHRVYFSRIIRGSKLV